MAVPMNTTITVSCNIPNEYSGPTIVHSTGVKNYRIQPELIRILQEEFTNERLRDHREGVECDDPPANVVQAFEKAGFSVNGTSESGGRKMWTLINRSGGGDEEHDQEPEPEPEPDEDQEQEDEGED